MSGRDDLAERIRSLVVLDPRVTEKRMFGGVAFLLDGRILVSALAPAPCWCNAALTRRSKRSKSPA